MKQLTDIIWAIYFCDVEKLRSAIPNPKQFNPYILVNDECAFHYPEEVLNSLPVYYLSIAQKRNLSYSWSFDDNNYISLMRVRNEQVLDFWKNECGFDTDVEIDYKKYASLCDILSDSVSDNEFLWYDEDASLEEVLAKEGCTEKELQLFMAVQRHNFDLVAELLKEGVNINKQIEFGCSAMEHIRDKTGCIGDFEILYDDYSRYFRGIETRRDTDKYSIAPVLIIMCLAAWNEFEDKVSEVIKTLPRNDDEDDDW